jgi:hypothetical protein
MPKIPVLDTIRAAYQFTFAHLGAIIGLIWMPMILATVIGYLVLQRFFMAMADAFASNNLAMMGPALLGLLSFALVALLLLAMMAAPVMQLALGSRKAGALLHFAFGPLEWRLFRAGLGITGFLFLILLVASMATAAAMGGGSPRASLAASLLFLACTLFFVLRFGFFAPAIAVAESEPVLPRSWLLSAGNFWRLFLVLVATLFPVRLAMVLIELGLEGPRQLEAELFTNANSTALLAAHFHAIAQALPVKAGLVFLMAPVFLGLVLGAGAHAYRAVRGEAAGI